MVFRRKGWFIRKSEVISLRTAGKRLPGKKLAVYIGAVVAVLVLSYNLIKDLSFILISDKGGVLKTTYNPSIRQVIDSLKDLYRIRK